MISAGYVVRRVGLCVAVMACAVTCMVSCGPKHEEFRPQLEVLLPSGGSLADGSVNYDARGRSDGFRRAFEWRLEHHWRNRRGWRYHLRPARVTVP